MRLLLMYWMVSIRHNGVMIRCLQTMVDQTNSQLQSLFAVDDDDDDDLSMRINVLRRRVHHLNAALMTFQITVVIYVWRWLHVMIIIIIIICFPIDCRLEGDKNHFGDLSDLDTKAAWRAIVAKRFVFMRHSVVACSFSFLF